MATATMAHAFELSKKAGREPFKVKDLSLAEWGRKEIRLAEFEMPGLMAIRNEYKGQLPLKGPRFRFTRIVISAAFITRWPSSSR